MPDTPLGVGIWQGTKERKCLFLQSLPSRGRRQKTKQICRVVISATKKRGGKADLRERRRKETNWRKEFQQVGEIASTKPLLVLGTARRQLWPWAWGEWWEMSSHRQWGFVSHGKNLQTWKLHSQSPLVPSSFFYGTPALTPLHLTPAPCLFPLFHFMATQHSAWPRIHSKKYVECMNEHPWFRQDQPMNRKSLHASVPWPM